MTRAAANKQQYSPVVGHDYAAGEVERWKGSRRGYEHDT